MDVSPEFNAIETQQNANYRLKNAKEKPEPEKPTNQIENESKGFAIDTDNRYHCLDCGKKFKLKYAYNQHQRL